MAVSRRESKRSCPAGFPHSVLLPLPGVGRFLREHGLKHSGHPHGAAASAFTQLTSLWGLGQQAPATH